MEGPKTVNEDDFPCGRATDRKRGRLFHMERPETDKEDDYSMCKGQRQRGRSFHVEGPKTDKEEDCSMRTG